MTKQGPESEERAGGGTGEPVLWRGSFPPEPVAVRQCRRAVKDVLRDGGVAPPLIDDAITVLGEMVGNAVRHARTEFTVTVVLVGATIRLEVFDRDTRPPALLGVDPESTSGRGLHIVAGIVRAWGWQSDEVEGVTGKRVWAELAQLPTADDAQG